MSTRAYTQEQGRLTVFGSIAIYRRELYGKPIQLSAHTSLRGTFILGCTKSIYIYDLCLQAAACTALVQRASPWNLEERVPTLGQIRDNIERYFESQRMLRDDEEETFSDYSPPPLPRDSWPVPSGSS